MINPAVSERGISARVERFTESVIREMTRLAMEHEAINLAQGFPDFPAPEFIKEAAIAAIRADVNQYSVTWGDPLLRQAIAAKYRRWYGLEIEADAHVTVCCGSTEAMISTLIAVLNPGDETVIFEPFYENYGPDSILSGAAPRFVPLRAGAGGWSFDREELRAAFNAKTRAIVLNTPNNPTGKVFTRAELEFIRDLCVEWDCLAITDEIYEHIIYDGAKHISMASLDGMRDRTITINGMSKTYSVTGWRVGWAIAPPDASIPIRKVHDFLTVGAAAPLQQAGATALELPPSYYTKLAENYRVKRDRMLGILTGAGFRCFKPGGAYYIMTDISGFNFPGDDVEFAKYLVKDIGIAVVPGSSFYDDPAMGAKQVRFTFCKKDSTLDACAQSLSKLKSK